MSPALLWSALSALAILVSVLLFFTFSNSSRTKQVDTLQSEVKRLTFELNAEKSKTGAYGSEAEQMQQSLRILEKELNRLKAKVKLPPTKIIPSPTSAPTSAPTGEKKTN